MNGILNEKTQTNVWSECTLGYEYEGNEYKDDVSLAMLAANR